MRHQKRTKKFKRTEEERKRLWIDLSQALILEGKIVTFTARAKWFKPKFERLVTLCKRAKGDKKLAYSKVRPFLSEKTARKLIEEIVPKLEDRQGGYTRILKLGSYFNEHDKSIVILLTNKEVEEKTKVASTPNEEVEKSEKEVEEDVAEKKTVKKPTTEKAKTVEKKTTTKKTTKKKEESKK